MKKFLVDVVILTVILIPILFSLVGPIFAVETAVVKILHPIADTYVDSDEPTASYGADTHLYVAFWTYNYTPNFLRHTYLLFDLTALFQELQSISSAYLRLYADVVWKQPAYVGVSQCSDVSWNEDEIAWGDAPLPLLMVSDEIAWGDAPLPLLMVSDTMKVTNENAWYTWNITMDVKNAMGQEIAFALTVQNPDHNFYAGFSSKDGSTNFPELVIEYEMHLTPEFSSVFIMSLFLISTLLAVTVHRRSQKQHRDI